MFSIDVFGGTFLLGASPSPPPFLMPSEAPSVLAAHFRVVWVYLGPDDAPRFVVPAPPDVAVPLACFPAAMAVASAARAACFPRLVFGAPGCADAVLATAGSFAEGFASGAGFGVWRVARRVVAGAGATASAALSVRLRFVGGIKLERDRWRNKFNYAWRCAKHII